ncbi:uncharacterized protein [Ptychodera flava]|uniref:uncharacterized protein n=1 Tax=Ptychodera flava TaxID=63121 RepID=UPI00396A0A57
MRETTDLISRCVRLIAFFTLLMTGKVQGWTKCGCTSRYYCCLEGCCLIRHDTSRIWWLWILIIGICIMLCVAVYFLVCGLPKSCCRQNQIDPEVQIHESPPTQ